VKRNEEKKTKEYTEMMEKEINSLGFLEKGRKKSSDFTRKRKLPFPKLCLFLLGIVHECLSVAFRRFTEKIGDAVTMTEQSLSEARNKIKWEAFAELSASVSDFAYTGDYARWNGYRLWGIDGTKFALPNYPELAEKFGDEKGSPTARGSILYDLMNYTVFDGQIENLDVDERTLAKRHLNALVERQDTSKELVIFDRGYPSEDMIDFCEENGLHYLMRVRTKFNVEVDNLPLDGGYVQIGKHKVRVVKVVLDTGEIETLLTNLTENFNFKELYFMRWGVEKEYDVLKNTLEIENFSGRTETAIRQDFHIHIIASNMLAASFWEAQEIVDAERNADDTNKYEYIVNTAQAAAAMRDYLILAILADSPRKRTRLLNKMHRIMADAVIPIRTDRIVQRKKNNRKSKFHHNRKPNL
jgi:hypothetical protein